jgi:hypothetical protein
MPSNSSWAHSNDGSAEIPIGVDVLYQAMLSKERPSADPHQDGKLDCQATHNQRDDAVMQAPRKQPQDDEEDRQPILLGAAGLLGTTVTRSMVNLCSAGRKFSVGVVCFESILSTASHVSSFALIFMAGSWKYRGTGRAAPILGSDKLSRVGGA